MTFHGLSVRLVWIRLTDPFIIAIQDLDKIFRNLIVNILKQPPPQKIFANDYLSIKVAIIQEFILLLKEYNKAPFQKKNP
jgi:hypothetical protein